MKRPVRIANCSGFFGDRLAAAQEMVEGGPIDVLTGDWLAELTMLILARQKMKHGNGYARTFLQQMETVLPRCLEKGIKVVSNAGGLDPEACAQAIRDLGAGAKVAAVTGDDVLPRFGEFDWTNLDTGEAFPSHPLSANAYLGARGIVAALEAGADVVVTGRVTDAALVIGPAAWWHGWDFDGGDLDAMAGALVAGHVIECGAQASGGNYPFFREVPGLEHVGFPIAEVAADGTSVITKHPDTGGLVSPGTVTAQLLYEVGDEHYLNPDVSARFDTIEIDQVGRDRVRLSGIRGESAPDTLKVGINYLGGFRNSMTLVLTGADTAEKADIAIRTICGIGLAEAKVLSPEELGQRSRLGVREMSVSYIPPASRRRWAKRSRGPRSSPLWPAIRACFRPRRRPTAPHTACTGRPRSRSTRSRSQCISTVRNWPRLRLGHPWKPHPSRRRRCLPHRPKPSSLDRSSGAGSGRSSVPDQATRAATPTSASGSGTRLKTPP